MLKTKTYFEQVSLEIVKRVAGTQPQPRKITKPIRTSEGDKK
jgi:hypothetical protein